MKAWVLPEVVCLTETSTPLRLDNLPVPTPGSGQIRVRVSACGVCHADVVERSLQSGIVQESELDSLGELEPVFEELGRLLGLGHVRHRYDLALAAESAS